MKAVDTNILVRFLMDDDELQSKKVYAIFKKAEQEKNELFVPLLVVLEMIWVLESVYKISKTDIVNAVRDLLSMPIFKFDQMPALQAFVHSAQDTHYDLSDLLIAHSAQIKGCETVLTFNRNASKFELFELI